MKKLQQTLIVGALLISPLAVGLPVSAEPGRCQEGFTGPNSDNLCVAVTEYTCTAANENHVTINNTNQQVAVSGSGAGEDNSESGSVQTGSATNDNNVTFNVTLTNGEVCAVVATMPPNPVPSAPVEVTKQPVPAPAKQAAPKLANTAGDKTAIVVTGALGVTAAVLVGLKTASWLRRR